jgi:hypothetical protein
VILRDIWDIIGQGTLTRGGIDRGWLNGENFINIRLGVTDVLTRRTSLGGSSLEYISQSDAIGEPMQLEAGELLDVTPFALDRRDEVLGATADFRSVGDQVHYVADDDRKRYT